MTIIRGKENIAMPSYYFERALFVVGEPNSGKSTQLRSMFRDIRLGLKGNPPASGKIGGLYQLSNERCLCLRLTSPHEAGEYIKARNHGRRALNFLDKTEGKIVANTPAVGTRWNFACPLQRKAVNRMPDAVATCKAFFQPFHPERLRVVLLSPDRRGKPLQNAQVTLIPMLQRIPSVEVCCVDARDRAANGLLLADFFDFT
jgi:hypothetical protein